jgi:hypothetical protein
MVGTFTPFDTPTLAWWLSFDETKLTTPTSNRVSQVDDQKGGYPPLTQPTEGQRPQTGTFELNGRNMLFFSRPERLGTYGDTFQVPDSGNLSIFMIVEVFLPLDNTADGMCSMTCVSECSDWQFVGGVNTANFNGRIVANELGGVNTNFTPAMGIGPALYELVFDFDNSTIKAYLSGVPRNETVAYTTKITNPQTFIMMANRVSNAIAGHWGETIIIEDNSEATRQKMEGYATWGWNLQNQLPSDHPYKNAAP